MPATDKLRASLADRYIIEREIGAGGMATVYLARDVKHDREVALKVLRPDNNVDIRRRITRDCERHSGIGKLLYGSRRSGAQEVG